MLSFDFLQAAFSLQPGPQGLACKHGLTLLGSMLGSMLSALTSTEIAFACLWPFGLSMCWARSTSFWRKTKAGKKSKKTFWKPQEPKWKPQATWVLPRMRPTHSRHNVKQQQRVDFLKQATGQSVECVEQTYGLQAWSLTYLVSCI